MNTHHGVTETRSNDGLLLEDLTQQIIGAAIEVHRELGPGLLESIYEECMCQELQLANIPFRSQVELPIADRKARWPDHKFQRSPPPSRHPPQGPMNTGPLCVSVSPWWMFVFGSLFA